MDPLSTLLKDLGSAIRALRKQTGLSQEHFADAIEIHRTEMGQLERGNVNVTVETLYRVADKLGVTVTELFVRAAGKGREASADPEAPPARGRRRTAKRK